MLLCRRVEDAAAQNDAHNALGFLVRAGANMNQADADGFTPVSIAAFKNASKSLKQLIDFKADLDTANNEGLTPIDVADDNDSAAALELLISARASGYEDFVDAKDTKSVVL